MNKIIIANWKMNGNIEKIINDFKIYINHDLNNNAIFLPPNVYLAIITNLLKLSEKKLNLGSQDISQFGNYGAYTGEISIKMLTDFNIKYALIGHSERRMMGENNSILRSKLINCINHKIIPILCIGETKTLRDNNTYLDLIKNQLEIVKNLNNFETLYIAYEPVWAIGSGIIPSIEQINEITIFIHTYLNKLNIKNHKIFYGGSVNISNTKQILDITNIDGLLIGGVSLKQDEFLEILKIANTYNS